MVAVSLKKKNVDKLQREEKLAREVLADYLWNRYNLDGRKPAVDEAHGEIESATPEETDPIVQTKTADKTPDSVEETAMPSRHHDLALLN